VRCEACTFRSSSTDGKFSTQLNYGTAEHANRHNRHTRSHKQLVIWFNHMCAQGISIPSTYGPESSTDIQMSMRWGCNNPTLHASCHLIVYCLYRTILQILTGRPSVLWHQGTQKINLTDFCEDAVDDCESIADLCAEWPAHVASEALELGLSCVVTGRRGVKQRPTVEKCIATVSGMMELPMLPLPAAQKECVVCLDAARGRHRFMPCECIPSLA